MRKSVVTLRLPMTQRWTVGLSFALVAGLKPRRGGGR